MPYYIVEGAGWGHLIGMSQYGAQAMAGAGSAYPEILAHYYGGLSPVAGDRFLPDQLAVGLVIGSESVIIRSDSPLTVSSTGHQSKRPNPGPGDSSGSTGPSRSPSRCPTPRGQPEEF